ncbi:MAG TPA: aldo/keto reductase [Candidatus Saccharimonadales bacterium]|nr:aldo/keto reductase [Candidatus Saccharimonadales bacterium]
MTSRSPLLTLNNGVRMPALGLGVFQSSPEQTVTAVESAIAQGYRLIDTAASYFNERQVGEGMRRSETARDDVFLETKVWISDYGHDATLHAYDKSAGTLGVDRLDLVLLHQPLPSRHRGRARWRTTPPGRPPTPTDGARRAAPRPRRGTRVRRGSTASGAHW